MQTMFDKYIHNFDPAKFKLFIYNESADIGGGRLVKSDIDKIANFPDEVQIRIMGLDQETFEYFVEKYGSQFKKILFWKNKRIEDLSPLSKLENLEEVYFFFNQRVTKLWNMKTNISLKTLCIEDFSKLKDLENIDTAPNLKNFYRGDAVWDTAIIESLKPLENSTIENLGFSCKRLIDESIEPLINMKHLKNLYCPTNKFTTEQCVLLSLKRPDVKGYISNYYVEWNGYLNIVGKRKPMLKIPVDEKKLMKYKNEWENIKANIR